MELISVSRRNELIDAATVSSLKIELRDDYAVDSATFQAWQNGDTEAVDAVIDEWTADIRAARARGRHGRRIKVVSEPLSPYHRFTYAISGAGVQAGEDLRWLPRRLTSTLALPGNDFMVLDGNTVVVNVLDGVNKRAEIQFFDEPDVVKFCSDAFEAAWPLAVPHEQYRPAV